jgi:hypothetical protein
MAQSGKVDMSRDPTRNRPEIFDYLDDATPPVIHKARKGKKLPNFYDGKNNVLYERLVHTKDIPNRKLMLNIADVPAPTYERPTFEGKTPDDVNTSEVVANKGILSRVLYKKEKINEGYYPHPNLTSWLPNPPPTNIISDTESSRFLFPTVERDAVKSWNSYKSDVILTPESSMSNPKNNYALLEPALIKTVKENQNTYNQSVKNNIPYNNLHPVVKDDYYLNRSKNENQKLIPYTVYGVDTLYPIVLPGKDVGDLPEPQWIMSNELL